LHHLAIDAKESSIRRACALAPLSVHEELMRIPFSFTDAGNLSLPQLSRTGFLPSCNLPSSAQQRRLPAIGGIGYRRFLRTRIGGGEHQRFRKSVSPATHINGHRPGERPLRLEFPHGVPSRCQRGEGPVRVLSIWLSQFP